MSEPWKGRWKREGNEMIVTLLAFLLPYLPVHRPIHRNATCVHRVGTVRCGVASRVLINRREMKKPSIEGFFLHDLPAWLAWPLSLLWSAYLPSLSFPSTPSTRGLSPKSPTHSRPSCHPHPSAPLFHLRNPGRHVAMLLNTINTTTTTTTTAAVALPLRCRRMLSRSFKKQGNSPW